MVGVPDRIVNGVLHNTEALMERFIPVERLEKGLSDIPSIFIIGPPRSGTTLLYQYICHYFDVSFVSNTHCYVYGSPGLSHYVLRRVLSGVSGGFDSEYGYVEGASGPSECGKLWYRFFPRGGIIVDNEKWAGSGRMMGWSISLFRRASSKAVVFKNVYNSLRIGQIVDYVRNPVFIVMNRNREDNIRSILKRRSGKGDIYKWRSVMPFQARNCIEVNPRIQVDRQIEGIYDEINYWRVTNGDIMFIDVQYEDLCIDPKKEMRRINNKLSEIGMVVDERASSEDLPDEFKVRGTCYIEEGR